MNYLKTLIFIIFINTFFYIIGSNLIHTFKFKNMNYAVKYVFGYFMFFFISWLVAFPCQIKGTTWQFFKVIFFIILLSLFIINIILFNRNNDIKITNKYNPYIINKITQKIGKHLKSYWFVYVLVLMFTFLSITNMQPYIRNNYTDDHYIVKMVHMTNSPHLFNMASGDGFIRKLNQNLVELQGYRKYNTYELVYSTLASFFNIDVTFFCRFSMTIINYLLVFSVFYAISAIFLDEEKAQYSLLVYPILFLPAGFLAKNNSLFHIRMFETWRFQTAIYMGGSITRVLAIPLFLYLLYLFVVSINSYKSMKGKVKFFGLYLLLLIGFTISILSFQTTAISYILLLLPFYLYALILTMLLSINDKTKRNKFTMISTVLFFIIIVSSDYYLNVNSLTNIIANIKIGTIGINLSSIQKSVDLYSLYYADTFTWDFFARYSFIALLLLLYLIKDKEKRLILLFISLIYLIFRLNKCKYFLAFISFTFFNTARMLTAILTLCMLMCGILIVLITSHCVNFYKIQFRYLEKKLLFLLAVASIAISSTIFVFKYNNFKNYIEDGDGFIKEGYSLTPILSNDKLLPDMFVKIGNYFEKRPEGYYTVAMEENIPYNNHVYSYQHLLLASHKIVRFNLNNAFGDLNSEFYKNMWPIQNYIQENQTIPQTYNSIRPHLKKAKIHYIFTTRLKIKNDLERNGFKCVCGGNSYWLLYKHNI